MEHAEDFPQPTAMHPFDAVLPAGLETLDNFAPAHRAAMGQRVHPGIVRRRLGVEPGDVSAEADTW